MNLVELDRALRQLRLSGMAAVLETRLAPRADREADADRSRLDARRPTSCCAGRTACSSAAQTGALPRSRPLARHLRFRFQQEDEPRADLRARHRPLHRAARGRALPRPARAPARATWPRPSAARRSSRATASSIARRTSLLEELADATLDGTRKELSRRPRHRAAAHHRRPRHAEAAAHRRRGSARTRHAPLRARVARS